MGFFLETLFGGLMAGMLYSLIALGFVLIYKASGVFNFAQGAMVLFAALAMSRFAEWIPQWLGFESLLLANLLAFVAAMAVMIMLAWAIERLCLSKLVNQEGITLLMATLGIAYFLDGFGQTLFGSDIYNINVGMPKDPAFILEGMFEGGVMISKEDLVAAVIAALLVVVLALFFQKTKTGRALAMEPQVLLLDEPMAGMNVEEKQDMCRFILDVNDEFGTTIVLIEHDMGVVMDISDRVVVLDYGKKIGDGTPEEVRANPDVISAYLGTSH